MKFCCCPEILAEKYLNRKRWQIWRTVLLLNYLIYHDENGQPFESSIMQNENAENGSRHIFCPDECSSLDLTFGIYWGTLGSKFSPSLPNKACISVKKLRPTNIFYSNLELKNNSDCYLWNNFVFRKIRKIKVQSGAVAFKV